MSDLGRMVRQGMSEDPIKLQKAVDRLGRTMKGRDLTAIETALAREVRQIGVPVPRAQITRYAECIRDGERITVRLR